MRFGLAYFSGNWRILVLPMLASLSLTAMADSATPEIGTAVLVKSEVIATLGEERRDLAEGGRVRRTEFLETGKNAQVEIKLDDLTKLALGPNAGMTLDEFAIGKSDGVTTIGVNFLKGTFRFITGAEDKEAYRIETPSATIGVRGTVFDVYVDGSGDTLVLLHEGEVDICSKTKSCVRHNSRGKIVHSTIGGVLSAPIKFSAGLIPGLAVKSAFPFVGRTLRIDPIRRLRSAQIIERPIKRAGRAVTSGTRSIGRKFRRLLR